MRMENSSRQLRQRSDSMSWHRIDQEDAVRCPRSSTQLFTGGQTHYLRSLALALRLSSHHLCCSLLFNNHVQMSQRSYTVAEGLPHKESPFPPRKAYECEASGETQACHVLSSTLARYEPSLTGDVLYRCLRRSIELISSRRFYYTTGQEVTA